MPTLTIRKATPDDTAAVEDCRHEGREGLVLTCKEAKLHYYAKFGFVNEGLSTSEHGGAEWYQMRVKL